MLEKHNIDNTGYGDLPFWIINGFYLTYIDLKKSDIDRFSEKWRGLTTSSFTDALLQGNDKEQITAIASLGFIKEKWVIDLLSPFLYQENILNKWISALMLGEQQDERAMDVLIEMITNRVSKEEVWQLEMIRDEDKIVQLQWWDHILSLHTKAIRVLGNTKCPTLAPLFRQVYITTSKLVHAYKDYPENLADQSEYMQLLRRMEILPYVFGKIGAFGALDGLEFPQGSKNLYKLMVARGAVDSSERYLDSLIIVPPTQKFKEYPEFKEQCRQVLEERFGLSLEEIKNCLFDK